jgi:hypothetical protein
MKNINYNGLLIRFRLFSEGKPTKPNKEEQRIRKKEYKPTTAELYKVLAVVKFNNR